MRVVIDQAKVKRRARLANAASVGGLLMLLASTILPYLMRGVELTASILMVVGLLTAMIGVYYANRWVRKPRPEVVLDTELKSLSNSYCLYHYAHKTADHLLLTPFGLTVLETVNLEGRFLYKNGRWQEFMRLGRAIRYIVEEHLGDPIKAAVSAQEHLHRQLKEKVEGGESDGEGEQEHARGSAPPHCQGVDRVTRNILAKGTPHKEVSQPRPHAQIHRAADEEERNVEVPRLPLQEGVLRYRLRVGPVEQLADA